MKVKEMIDFLNDQDPELEIFSWQRDYNVYEEVGSISLEKPTVYPDPENKYKNSILIE